VLVPGRTVRMWAISISGHEPIVLLSLWVLQKFAQVTYVSVIESRISGVMCAVMLQRMSAEIKYC
jgi:hypothetical protein